MTLSTWEKKRKSAMLECPGSMAKKKRIHIHGGQIRETTQANKGSEHGRTRQCKMEEPLTSYVGTQSEKLDPAAYLFQLEEPLVSTEIVEKEDDIRNNLWKVDLSEEKDDIIETEEHERKHTSKILIQHGNPLSVEELVTTPIKGM
ncbi:5448_t:CDS:2 [Acaulospora morrowiae]|uniref:5448_t:CDS:1 n=1 Tax=Acaulospora morrowiae TaxID=94023 RepID=A0A9N9AD16_9GLOM|nr:5448_t:CDS:2 [Acaulospora morrowiae]